MSIKRFYTIFLVIGIACFFCACDTMKYVPASDQLYTGAGIKTDSVKLEKSMRNDLVKLIKPEPNSNIFGVAYKLMIFSAINEPKKPKGLLYKAKYKLGEPPVLLSTTRPKATAKRLEDELFNMGYLRPKVATAIVAKNRKAAIDYTVNAGTRYKIRSIIYPPDTTSLAALIRESSPEALFKEGTFFDLKQFKAERERISAILKEKGYYFFEPDYLLYRVDSIHNGSTDVYITIKEQTPENALKLWKIGDITVYGNYSLEKDSMIAKLKGKREKRFTVVDKKDAYNTGVYERAITLKEGQLYSTSRHTLTIERLMNLGTFRFVKTAFFVAADSAVPTLNTRVYLSPAKKQSLRFEVSANSKSNNFLGSEVTLNYRNVNLLKGAEIFEAKITAGIDGQVGGQQVSSNSYSLNAEVNLYIPKLIPYFKVRIQRNPYLPRTVITPALEYVKRPDLYTLRSIRFSYGYHWKRGKTVEHNLKLLHINSIDPSDITPKFDSILAQDVSLKASFEKQLIIGTRYLFQFNNTFRTKKRFNYAFDGSISTSGNLVGLFIRAKPDTPGAKKIFNIPVSQFIRLQADLRGYWQLQSKLTWANRIIAGVGYAYGNSTVIPYAEQFFIGGSSSIRAFRARTLGPGSYHTTEKVFQANESGDVKLELNSELRYNLSKYVKLAFFADAGNIWLRNEATDKPGSGFDKGDIWKEIAVGTGAGIRFDASVLVIRFDLAVPLRKPWYPEGNRWVLNEMDFGNKQWRKDNLIMNIGIGYPF